MKCPKCEVIELTMADRAGVEIDYCVACRGVWLDRGELDKIIDRAALPGTSNNPEFERQRAASKIDRKRERFDEDDDDRKDRGRRKNLSGLLGEIFDF